MGGTWERANQSRPEPVRTFLVSPIRARSRRPFPAGIEPTFKFTAENRTCLTTVKRQVRTSLTRADVLTMFSLANRRTSCLHFGNGKNRLTGFAATPTPTGNAARNPQSKPTGKSAWEVCLSIERAERFAKNGTLTEQAAKKIIGEIVERTTGEPLHHYAAADWFDEW